MSVHGSLVSVAEDQEGKNIRIVTDRRPFPVGFGDTAQLDAFSRLKVSQPYGVFDYKQLSTNSDYQFYEVLTGSATATYQYDRSSTYLTTTTASGDRVIRQTARYFPYVSGKAHTIMMTGVFGDPDANVNQYIAYGDDLNMVAFTYQGDEFGVLLRTSTSGTPVDTFIRQQRVGNNPYWNIDQMDGSEDPMTNPSGINLDLTKTHIFIIDFQWLGVGRVRFSLDIDGIQYPVHEINNANNLDVVYMKTPTLPVRYEVHNVGTASASTTLEQICIAVFSDGGYAIPGLEFSVGNGVTRRDIGTTRTPVMAIRLKNAFPAGESNRRTIKFIDFGASATSQNAYVEVAHVHNPSAITADWIDVDDSSACEYSVNISALTTEHEHVIQPLNVLAGSAGKGGADTASAEFINVHSYVTQNFDSTNSDMFVVYATSEAVTSGVTAHITFLEIE